MIYLIVFALSLWGVYYVNRVSPFLQKVLFVLVVLLSAGLFGLRDKSIGTDTGGYVLGLFSTACHFSSWETFINRSFSFLDLEILYTYWNFAISLVSHNFNVFLFFTGLLMYSVFFYGFFRAREKISLAFAFFIFFFVFYNASYNILRQYMAMSFCMVGFSMLMEEKYKRSVLCTIIACGFHQTAILFIFVIVLKMISNRYYWLLSFLKVRILFTSILAICLMCFSSVLSFFEKIGLDDKYSLRYGSANSYGASFPFSIFALCMVNLIVLYSARKNRDDAIFCFFEYIMISSVILCFAGLISVFATRMSTYYLICSCLMIPYIFKKYIVPTSVKKGYVLFIFVYWFLIVIVANLSDTFPYKSVILGL